MATESSATACLIQAARYSKESKLYWEKTPGEISGSKQVTVIMLLFPCMHCEALSEAAACTIGPHPKKSPVYQFLLLQQHKSLLLKHHIPARKLQQYCKMAILSKKYKQTNTNSL